MPASSERMLESALLLSASRQNLWRLVFIRVLVLSAQAASVGIAYVFDLLPLPWVALCTVLLVSLSLIAITVIRLRVAMPVTEFEYAAQLGMDLIIHSVLLYFSGGSTNPFVSYYLVPLTIAAATLPWLYSMVLSALALTGYTALLMWYHPLHPQAEHEVTFISLHLFGMWLNFALSAAFITFFVVKMAGALRRQDQLQAEHREASMRDQRLLAVATQAAGAAHELGTPLATMSVLLKELRREHQEPMLQEDLAVLQDQVNLCKETLQQLVRAAEADRRQTVFEQSITEWLEAAVERWHLMRPETTYRYEVLGLGAVPTLKPSTDLTQALLNLLNNAADACPDNLRITVDWSALEMRVSIRDFGAGVPLEIAEKIGKPFFTTKGKGKGFGLGLFLTQAAVTRAGGSVKLFNQDEGGTLTELKLPRLTSGVAHE